VSSARRARPRSVLCTIHDSRGCGRSTPRGFVASSRHSRSTLRPPVGSWAITATARTATAASVGGRSIDTGAVLVEPAKTVQNARTFHSLANHRGAIKIRCFAGRWRLQRGSRQQVNSIARILIFDRWRNVSGVEKSCSFDWSRVSDLASGVAEPPAADARSGVAVCIYLYTICDRVSRARLAAYAWRPRGPYERRHQGDAGGDEVLEH
jgi:hypothetical protein